MSKDVHEKILMELEAVDSDSRMLILEALRLVDEVKPENSADRLYTFLTNKIIDKRKDSIRETTEY